MRTPRAGGISLPIFDSHTRMSTDDNDPINDPDNPSGPEPGNGLPSDPQRGPDAGSAGYGHEPAREPRVDERPYAGGYDYDAYREPQQPLELDQIEEEEPEKRGHRGGEMGFFDHLEELRSRIIKSLAALVVTSAVCGVFLKFIMQQIILGPANRLGIKLQNIETMGQITLSIQVALISGLILSIPLILWQFWGFIKPGLYESERKNVGWIAGGTILCFIIGLCFAYFVMIPTSLGFAASFVYEGIENRFSVASYFSFVLGFTLACGVVFEMPMLSYALARFGVVTPQFLRRYWRHAVVVILVAAAIITPTPDPFNQLLLAVPLYGLYEISILVAKLAYRKREEAEVEAIEEGVLDQE
ncbi:MAG: tatC [Chlorobi bacterium]|nr:tatC [Chlorobiota bacterium]